MNLTFKDFLRFVRVRRCHYCERRIVWHKKASRRVGCRKYVRHSMAYYLDRKNNAEGYSKENCVVCCTLCNLIKGRMLTYEEMLLLVPGLRKIAELAVKVDKPGKCVGTDKDVNVCC